MKMYMFIYIYIYIHTDACTAVWACFMYIHLAIF